MLAEVTTFEATLWVAAVTLVALAAWVAAVLSWAVIDATLVARRYYRENPKAVPPDHFLVRVGLAGSRRRAKMRETNHSTRRPW